MGRAIAFDLDRAMNAAMRQFWKGGYPATSLQDLLQATGLGAGSFYNTLKSKKHLFLECLRRYGDTEVRARTEVLAAAETTSLGLRAMYKLSFDALDDPDTPSRLCLMAGLISPDVLADPDMRAIVEEGQRRFQHLLTGLITRDIAQGHLPRSMDAEATASVIAIFGQGLLRMGLISYDRKRCERDSELLLSSLGL